ncbi:MAG: glutamate--tRNA ligase [Rhodospirillales bacterium]|nr:glutamate--tRNA ligase [Rhodospirillales bacterium]
MSIVTRFPPSPTGFMHIGNARTAYFNWLYARRYGGKFVVRIEDTDRARYQPEYVEAITNALDWMGLDHDGEIVSQFSRQPRHAEVAQALLDKGQAYYCYCSPEELEAMRVTSKAEGRATFYDRRWRDRDPSEAPAGVKPVVRIKAPLTGVMSVHDEVQGDVSVAAEQIDDFIILRSDGVPTYMLAVVVDDHDMGITHVIRGDDHLNNVFRQNVIYDAMGWAQPVYAHLPLILGPDGAKLSKRHGAASVEDFRGQGYLPEAMKNYLLKLGWSHGDDEIISNEQALEWFDLSGVNKSAGRFDYQKFESLNAHYLREAEPARLIDLMRPVYARDYDLVISEEAARHIAEGMDELKERAKTVQELAREALFYVRRPAGGLDEKAQKTLEEGTEILGHLLAAFVALATFDPDTVKDACMAVANDHAGGKLGKVGMPLRVALTGTMSSPTIFNVAAILGKDETCARIQTALTRD